jgi:hypothetical protein
MEGIQRQVTTSYVGIFGLHLSGRSFGGLQSKRSVEPTRSWQVTGDFLDEKAVRNYEKVSSVTFNYKITGECQSTD